jgi:hypothetical protein
MENDIFDIDREAEAFEYHNAQPKSEVITVKMDAVTYRSFDPETRELMEIQYIEPEFDYAQDELWQQLNRDATKAYKEKKKREYDLRNKLGL